MELRGKPLVAEPDLDDGVVRLRRWALTDLPCIEAASREGVIPESTSVPSEFSQAAGRAWVERQHSRVHNGQGWSLAICDLRTGTTVGCAVLLLRPQDGVGGVGYWLVPEARGEGFATRAVTLLSGWGLRQVGLARVEAWVEPDNHASVDVLTRSGFVQEGRLRSFLAFPSRRADALVFSRVATPQRAT